MPTSRRVVLAARPDGIPQSQHFRLETAEVPTLKPGEILVRNQFLSVEPAMRGWVSAVAN
jgi:NADPH-dependent curcumin reductase CurA